MVLLSAYVRATTASDLRNSCWREPIGFSSGFFFSSVKFTQQCIPSCCVVVQSFVSAGANCMGIVSDSTGVWHSCRFLNCTCRWNTLQRCSSRSGYPSCYHCSSLWCLVSFAAEESAQLIRLIHTRPLLIDCMQVYLDTCARLLRSTSVVQLLFIVFGI